MTGHYASPKPDTFQDMAALALDVGLFTSEFRLCDTIAEYLADIVAQSHEDPARYANFSSQMINEIVELAFRSAGPGGNIDFNLLKSEDRVRVSVGFTHDGRNPLGWGKLALSDTTGGQHPAHSLLMLSDAIRVDFHSDTDGDDRVTLTADFDLRESGR